MIKIRIPALMLALCGGMGFGSAETFEPDVYRLWEKTSPRHQVSVAKAETMDKNGHVWNVSDPTLAVYGARGENSGVGVVICPGGGYAFGSYLKEGVWFAEWLAENGITAAVLKYRMPDGNSEVPAEDVSRAFAILKEHWSKYGLDIAKTGVMGFSAGGHLAATMAVHGENDSRPAFGVLMYPVISMAGDLTHQGSRKCLLGENPESGKVDYYSAEKWVGKDTPPVLLMASYDDKTVNVKNSMLFFDALKANGIPASLYIFPTGGHGWGFKEDFRYHEVMKNLLLDWLKAR